MSQKSFNRVLNPKHLIMMKPNIYRITCFAFFLSLAVFANAHDFFLLPANFILKTGEELKVSLMIGDNFKDLKEHKYESSKTTKFMLYQPGKPIDLKNTADSTLPVLNQKLEKNGLYLLVMDRDYATITMQREAFLAYLNEEGLTQVVSEIEKTDQKTFNEKYTRYLKTLVTVNKPAGDLHKQKIGQKLEMLLQQNPYKLNYGDDMVAEVLFENKPLENANIKVFQRSVSGKVTANVYRSDDKGLIYFKLNQTGTYLLTLVHMLPLKEKGNYESFWGAYSFAFQPEN